MSREIGHETKKPVFKIGPAEIPFLLKQGAEIVIFQNFLGGQEQDYITMLSTENVTYTCRHKRALPFIITKSGKVVFDIPRQLQANRYHPS